MILIGSLGFEATITSADAHGMDVQHLVRTVGGERSVRVYQRIPGRESEHRLSVAWIAVVGMALLDSSTVKGWRVPPWVGERVSGERLLLAALELDSRLP